MLTVRGAAAGLGVALGGLAGPELVDCNGGKGALLLGVTLLAGDEWEKGWLSMGTLPILKHSKRPLISPATVQPSAGRLDLFWRKISTTASVADSRGAIFIPICFFFNAFSDVSNVRSTNV